MSDEKFGLSIGGPIRLPCDSVLMHYMPSDSVLVHYIISFIQWPAVSVDLEKALLNSVATTCCCSSLITFQHGHNSRQLSLCGYLAAVHTLKFCIHFKPVQILFVLKLMI